MTVAVAVGGLALALLAAALLFHPRRPWWSTAHRDRFLLVLSVVALVLFTMVTLRKIVNAPMVLWNGARIAPLIGWVRGWPMYASADADPVLDTIYGPMAYLGYLPAALARTSSSIIVVGQVLALLWFVGPMVWLHLGPGPNGSTRRLGRWVGLALFLSLVPVFPVLAETVFFVHADAPGLGLATCACAALYGRRKGDSSAAFIASAACAVLAVATKQTFLPLLVALVLWVWLEEGRKAAGKYFAALCGCGVCLGALLLAVFDPERLWFNLVVMIKGQPWWGAAHTVIPQSLGYLVEQSAIPVLVIGVLLSQRDRSSKAPPRWMLPCFVALFLVPTAVMGHVKVGGGLNSLSLVVVFVSASATLGLGQALDQPDPSVGMCRMASVWLTLLVALQLGPGVSAASAIRSGLRNMDRAPTQVAARMAQQHPSFWFPWQPLSSLIAEDKLYHFEYGLFERHLGGNDVPKDQFLSGIPLSIEMVIFPPALPSHINKPEETESLRLLRLHVGGFERKVTIPDLPGWTAYAR